MAKSLIKKTKASDASKQDADKTVLEQQQESKALVDANATKHLYEDNMLINAMLTRASQFGELLDQDEGYKQDAEDVAKAKEITDTQVVTFIKHIDRVLDDEKRAKLPWPGSLMATEIAKLPAGSNQEPLFDKVMAAGGNTKSFYNQMMGSTKLGKQALDEIDAVQKELDKAKVEPDKARLPANLEADMKRAKSKFAVLLSALRTAAQVRLMMEDIKQRCPYIMIEWIRQEISDEQAELLDPHADLTMLNVEHAGDVVKSSTCLNIWTKPLNPALMLDAQKKAKSYSVGSFKRWKVDKAIEIAKAQQRTRVTRDDLISSAKAPVVKSAKTPTVSNVRDVNSWTQLVENVEAVLRYWNDDPTKASARHAEFVGSMAATDDTLDSMYQLYITLRARFEGDPSLARRAIEVHEKLNAA